MIEHYKDDWFFVDSTFPIYVNIEGRYFNYYKDATCGVACSKELLAIVKLSPAYKQWKKKKQFHKELAEVLKC